MKAASAKLSPRTRPSSQARTGRRDLRAVIGGRGRERGSTFIIVLWIALGLVSLALYFGQSMNFELRAADNQVSGLAAEQAIEGAARYIAFVLVNLETNGIMPDPTTYLSQAVAVGETRGGANDRGVARFWLIGRDTNNPVGPDGISFGLVDEASKLNLNVATSNVLANLSLYVPSLNLNLVAALLDWRDTNGGSGTYQTYYGMSNPSYQNKSGPFETVEELRLLYGADMDTLVGDDRNRNGIQDPNENNLSQNGTFNLGLLEYVTVYSREPNTYSNGLARINIRTVSSAGPLPTLLQSTFGSARASAILTSLGLVSAGRAAPANGPAPANITLAFTSPLQFYRASRMTSDEFAQIANALSTVNGATNYIVGRVNVNTASANVLGCLPGLSANPDMAQTLITYREQNPDKIGSIAWVADALGTGNASVLDALQATDCITTQTYVFTADIAALGPYGRGYRRVRFVFDTADGTPRIIYRQDLTHLGWALGQQVRQTWLHDPQTAQVAAR